jgi:hypothetical protein
MKTVLFTRQQISATFVSFPVVDNKGRVVGARTVIDLEEHAEAPAGATVVYSLPAGTSYVLHMRATRGGKDFGPAFNRSRHATLEEAQAKQALYFKQAEKRARKQFPAGGAA